MKGSQIKSRHKDIKNRLCKLNSLGLNLHYFLAVNLDLRFLIHKMGKPYYLFHMIYVKI